MKNIIFLTYYMGFGGVEKVIATLSNKFSEKGIKCTIITLRNDQCVYTLNSNIDIIPLYDGEGTPTVKEYGKCFIYLRKLVKEIQPDVILSMPEEISCKAIPFLIGLKIPIVVSERNNPWIMPQNKINRLLRRIFYPFVNGIVFQTKEAGQFFSRNIRNKSTVIPNPLDLSRIPEEWEAPRRKEIVSVGRLESQKNYSLLINAFSEFYKKHNEYCLIIYGKGSEKEALEDLAKNKIPESAYYFAGVTNDVLKCINGSFMFVLSSDYEGLPNILIEAMALGLPCISTNCKCGPRSLIENGLNGLLIPVRNEKAMVQAMCHIAENEEHALSMGKEAMLIKERLNTDKIVERWKIYIECIYNKNKNNF